LVLVEPLAVVAPLLLLLLFELLLPPQAASARTDPTAMTAVVVTRIRFT
jgi:hypothetical protein